MSENTMIFEEQTYYNKAEREVKPLEANLISIFLTLIPMIWIKISHNIISIIQDIDIQSTLGLFLIMLASLFLHELIHLLTALVKVPLSSIRLTVRKGFFLCEVHYPMSRNHFILYALMPSLVLSIIGILLYIILSECIIIIGMLIIIIGIGGFGGDLLLIITALKFPSSYWIWDKGETILMLEKLEH